MQSNTDRLTWSVMPH